MDRGGDAGFLERGEGSAEAAERSWVRSVGVSHFDPDHRIVVRPLAVGSAAAQLSADEALLEEVARTGRGVARWYVVDRPAVVVGFAQRARVEQILDQQRCQAAGLPILARGAGGGVVLLDAMVCLTVALPALHPLVSGDLTESYRWLGDRLAKGLQALGVTQARRVEVDEARASVAPTDVADPVGRTLMLTCYGRLSPHEVVADEAKVAGLAQIRRQHVALYQAGVLLRSQAPLADLLVLEDGVSRPHLADALAARSAGLEDLLGHARAPAEVVRVLQSAVFGP